MFRSLMVSISAIVIMMLVWSLVQVYWGKFFGKRYEGKDVLQFRKGCSGCSCTTSCKKV